VVKGRLVVPRLPASLETGSIAASARLLPFPSCGSLETGPIAATGTVSLYAHSAERANSDYFRARFALKDELTMVATKIRQRSIGRTVRIASLVGAYLLGATPGHLRIKRSSSTFG